MNSRSIRDRICPLPFLLLVIPLLILASPQTSKKLEDIPKTDAIEKELWNLINRERSLHNLSLLELSSPLSDMARQHSQDMAHRGEASHLSSNGKTLTNRLEDADVYFIDAGENVASSDTFVAEFIHESFIKSGKGHRENILDPDFTQVGIGVVQLDQKEYYITQDFLRPLLFKTDEQVSQIVLDHVNEERHLLALPPLELWPDAELFAQNLAENKASNQDLPKIPPEFGETYVVLLSTPNLAQEGLDFPEAVNPRYNKGALGIWFGKNKNNPGGVYSLALMLFAENVSLTLSPEEQKQYLLESINKIRTESGLKKLILDEELTQAANRMVAKAARRRSEVPIVPKYEKYETLTYGTEDLALLPNSLDSMVRQTQLKKIGIGLSYKKIPGSRKGTFFISLICE